jgi:hypothetical protein
MSIEKFDKIITPFLLRSIKSHNRKYMTLGMFDFVGGGRTTDIQKGRRIFKACFTFCTTSSWQNTIIELSLSI